MAEIELSGLDGSNLVAYMAALGTFRVLAENDPAPCLMRWRDAAGVWKPVISCSCSSPELFADGLSDALESSVASEAWSIGDDLTLRPNEFAAKVADIARSTLPKRRASADFMAAFACESCARDEKLSDTALRTMSGAGHQHFLKFMRELKEVTRLHDLAVALFEPWKYGDDRPSMRWDPNDYRPYALRAVNPSTEPIRTVRGANRLAVEALPLFSVLPTARGLRTTGFSGVQLSWPIWMEAVDLGSVRSLLAQRGIVEEHPDRAALRARGVVQVYRSRRFVDGKIRNFTHSRELL